MCVPKLWVCMFCSLWVGNVGTFPFKMEHCQQAFCNQWLHETINNCMCIEKLILRNHPLKTGVLEQESCLGIILHIKHAYRGMHNCVNVFLKSWLQALWSMPRWSSVALASATLIQSLTHRQSCGKTSPRQPPCLKIPISIAFIGIAAYSLSESVFQGHWAKWAGCTQTKQWQTEIHTMARRLWHHNDRVVSKWWIESRCV